MLSNLAMSLRFAFGIVGKISLLHLFACAMLLALPGCRLPALCAPEAGPGLPGDFNGETTAENSAQVGLYEFFDDPILTDLLTQGLAQNQELKIRNQELQIAANQIMARRGAYFPFVTGAARGGVGRGSRYTPAGAAEDQLTYPGGGRFPSPLTNVGLSANLFWNVDIWRQLRNARDAAQQRYCEAVDSRNFLVTRLVAETAEKYYELAALDKRLVFLEQTIELQKQSLVVATAQKEAAQGTELSVQRFLAEVRKNESQRLIVRQKIIETENRINFLTGRYPQPVTRMTWDTIHLDARMVQVGIPAQLMQNRWDILAAEREVIASGLDIKVARANFYPKLVITAGVGYEAFSTRYLFDPASLVTNAAGELVAPLINKAAIRADYLSANARQIQAVYNYQRTVLMAYTEVTNAVNKVDNYRRSVDLKLEEVAALESSVTVARDLFQTPLKEEFARVEYVDVLLATRDLLEARTALLETKQQQLSGIINAYQALGGGYLLTSAGNEFTELFYVPEDAEFTEEEMVPQLPPQPAPLQPAPPAPVPDQVSAATTRLPAVR